MKKEILMSLEANEKRVAILENGKLEEYYIEREETQRMFGNIYKGTVKSVVPGIGAAFIDLGLKKDGFLYVSDAIGSPLETAFEEFDTEDDEEEEKQGSRKKPHRKNHRDHRKDLPRIDSVLSVGQEIIVQVVKEPIRNKGARLTTHFSIPARYLVLMPGERKIGISRRVDDRKERERIRKIFAEIDIPSDVGFIVRTAGEGKSKREFIRDVKYLIKTWNRIKNDIQRKKGPCQIHEELDLVERMIRDYFTEDMDKIVVDHYNLYTQVRRFFKSYMPGYRAHVEWHRGPEPLFEKYLIEKEIAKTFQRNVMLKSRGHIVIEQTESLVAIDINTGKFTGKRDLEETVYRTNIEAAHEIARQIRLRDMGGIIIIDFIDMEREDHRRSVYRIFRDAIQKKDRAKTNILSMSDIGLVEMTRQRLRPSLESALYDSCPYCRGKGMVKSANTMSIQSVKEIRKSLNSSKGKVLNVYVHPDVADRLLHQEQKSIQELERMSKSRILVLADPALHIEDVNITFIH